MSIDGEYTVYPLTGTAASAYNRFFLFIKGGVLVGNPIDPHVEPMRFLRLFDFGLSGYSPSRTMAKAVGGEYLLPTIATPMDSYTPRASAKKLSVKQQILL